MGYRTWNFRGPQSLLRCDAAGPKDRDLTLANLDLVTVVWFVDVINPDVFGVAKVNRRTMHGGEAAAYLNRANGMRHAQRPHADHHITAKGPGTLAGNVGVVHCNVSILFNMAQGYARLE